MMEHHHMARQSTDSKRQRFDEGAGRMNQHKRQGRKRTGPVTRGRVAAAGAVTLAGFIILNAVALQPERHPTPMFTSIVPAPPDTVAALPLPPARADQDGIKTVAFEARPVAGGKITPPEKARPSLPASSDVSEAMLAEIQRELGKRGYYKGEVNGRPGPATAQAIRDFQFSRRVAVDGRPSEALLRDVAASRITMKDELLDLVKRTAQEDKTPQADKAVKTVMDIQRALNKAGYGPVNEDGQMGPTTKAALARFEQDRKLPPRGEAKGPVLKMLAAISGIAIAQ